MEPVCREGDGGWVKKKRGKRRGWYMMFFYFFFLKSLDSSPFKSLFIFFL
jgi:hypothetical protein